MIVTSGHMRKRHAKTPHPAFGHPPHEPLGTSNIQHPTSNTQPPINGPIGNHWLFDVGCWVLDVFLRFMGSMRDIFGEFSPQGEGIASSISCLPEDIPPISAARQFKK